MGRVKRRNPNKNYVKISKRRAKSPDYLREFIHRWEPYTLRWWMSRLAEASHEQRLAIMDGDVYNSLRFIRLWGWIQYRIIEKYGE